MLVNVLMLVNISRTSFGLFSPTSLRIVFLTFGDNTKSENLNFLARKSSPSFPNNSLHLFSISDSESPNHPKYLS